jgi:hypothetical protein
MAYAKLPAEWEVPGLVLVVRALGLWVPRQSPLCCTRAKKAVLPCSSSESARSPMSQSVVPEWVQWVSSSLRQRSHLQLCSLF